MRKIYFLLLLVLFAGISNAQLTGTKTIPGDYASVAAAVTDLNTVGVGTGGVTFNVAAGYSETLTGKITIIATGTASNPIVFQKSGAGANPVLTSYVGTVATPSVVADGFIVLAGSDYVTFDGINLTESAANTTTTTVMEFGFGLFKASATDGAQNNTIKNCTITLNRVQNTAWTAPGYQGSIGIAVLNSTNTAAAALTVTSAAGSNSNNKFYTNTIQNCNAGIAFVGYVDAVSPYSNADTGNDVGGSTAVTGNSILNFGGAAAAANPAAGIYASAQNSFNCRYNLVNNNNGAGVNHVNTLRGIFWTGGLVSSSGTCSDNTVTVTSGATTSQLGGIEFAASSNSSQVVTISNNTVTTTYPTATSGSSYPIYTYTATPGTLNLNSNTVSLSTAATSSTNYPIYNTCAVVNILNINSNTIAATLSGGTTSLTFRSIFCTGGAATCATSISSNNFNSVNFTGTSWTGPSAAIYHTGTPLTSQINSNNFNNLTLKNTGTTYLIYNSYTAPANGTKSVQNNSVITALSRPVVSTNSFFCYYDFGSSLSSVSHVLSGNNFSNITPFAAGSSGGFYGIYSADYALGSNPGVSVYGNTINNNTYNGTGTFYGYYLNGVGGTAGSPNEIRDNVFTGNTSASTSTSQCGIIFSTQVLYLNVYNNTIQNNTYTGAASQFVGIYGGGASNAAKIYNNTVTGNTVTTSANVGVFVSAGTQMEVYQNKINSLTGALAWGIYVNGGTLVNVYDHKTIGVNNYSIYGLSSNSATGVAEGIRVAGGTAVNVYKNNIYGLTNSTATTTATSFVADGICLTGGTTANVFNNMIGDLTAPSAGVSLALAGIQVNSATASTSFNVYNNTVYLSASSTGVNFGTVGLYHSANATGTTARLDLRNNILVNNSTAAGTGVTAVFRRSSTALGNYASTSDRNLFYTSSGSIMHDGTTSYDLAAFKTLVTPRDQNSISENPNFLSTTGSSVNFLHIDPSVPTLIESGASSILPLVATDFDGDARTATPDIGADEFVGSTPAPSLAVPTILPAGNQCVATARTVTVTATTVVGTISGVVLNYTLNGVSQAPISMTNSSGNTWTATIPAASPAGLIDWSVTATNTVPLSTSITGTSYRDDVSATFTPSAITLNPSGPVCLSGATAQLVTASGGTMTNISILSENFNGTAAAWTRANNSTGGTPANAAWILQPNGYVYSTYGTWNSNDNSQFILSNSDAQGSGTTATLLTSPSFSTVGFTSVSLSFYHYFRQAGTANVEASLDGTSWSVLQSFAATVGATNGFVNANINFPNNFLNKPVVYIRFKYDASWQYFWGIDNVEVKGNINTSITWSPTGAGLYTDAGATTAYTGSVTNTVYALPANTQTFQATSSYGIGCGTQTAQIIVAPALVAYNVTGGGTYCASGLGVPVGLSNSATGVNYQLQVGGVNSGSPIVGTGAAISFGNQTAAGTYTVVATDATTNCTNTMTGSVTISINPLPTQFSVTGGGAYCASGAGVAVGLAGSETGVNYQLQIGGVNTGSPVAGTGSAISFGNQTAAGVYTVVATNGTTNCTSNMTGSVTVSIDPLPTQYSVTGGGAYCFGGVGSAIGLSNSQVGVNYQLVVNGTTNVGSPVSGTGSAISFGLQTAAGTYTVVATNATTACTDNMTGSVTVSINALPTITPTLTEPTTCATNDGGAALTLGGAAGPYTFNWTGLGSVQGQQNQTTLYTGTYSVIVTAANGCQASSSFTLIGPGGCFVCPTVAAVSTTPAAICQGGTATLSATGLADMGISYGIGFVVSATPLANPYTGTIVATVANGSLTNGGSTATATYAFNTPGAQYVYAILSPSPADPACRPFQATTVTVNANPTITLGSNPVVCAGATGASLTYTGTDLNLTLPSGILYQQTATVVTGVISQEAPGGDATRTTESADDFTVPAGQNWQISRVKVNLFSSITPAYFNVRFYSNSAGAPGTLFASQENVATYTSAAGTSGGFDYTIDLPTAVSLPGGNTYWIVAQASTTATFAYWSSAAGAASNIGNQAAFRNPALGFGIPCLANWVPISDPCTSVGGTWNLLFTMTGTQNSGSTYNLTWSAAALAQGFTNLTGATLPAGAINLNVPVGAAAGTYSGTVTVINPNGCSTTAQNFTVTVVPTPTVNTVSAQAACNGATVNVPFSGFVAGTVYEWTNNNTAIGLAASGTGSLNFTATNSTNAPITANIVILPKYTGSGITCTGTPIAFTITINPTPTVNAVASETLCSGGATTAVAFSGAVTGTVYNWTNNTPSIGLAATGTGNIASFTAINTGTAPVVATITVTPEYTNGGATCTGTPTTYTITVLPTGQVNTVSNQVVCNGDNTSAVTFATANTGGATTYSWTNSNPTIGLVASGTGNIASFAAVNTGTTPVTATITVTPSYTSNGVTCSGTPRTFTITVNPTPTVNAVSNEVVCNGANTTAVTFGGAVAGTVYSWTNNTTSIGLAASGTGNIASFAAVNTGTTPVTATITVTPSYTNGGVTCTGTPTSYTITVNPTPTVNTVANQAVCNGSNTTAVTFSGAVTGTVYNWTNNTTSIGLAANGTGNIASFVGVNTGTTPVVATITVTPSANGCSGTPSTFTITVNPTPTVNAVSNQVICNGSNTTAVAFSGAVTGTVYSWTNNTTSIGLAASGTGNIASFAAVNTGTTPVTATITVTPSYTNGGVTCTGTPTTFTITVNPTPTVNVVANQVLCNGSSTTAVTFTGAVAGTVYTWTNTTTSIGLAASGTGNIASFVGVNAGTAPVVATITVTPSANGCSGTPRTFTITVNPTPTVNVVANQVVCNRSNTTAVAFTGAVTGTVYNWTNNTPSIGLAASGTGDIAAFAAVNTTQTPVVATITVTPSFTNGGVTCLGTPRTFTITVNPTPIVSATDLFNQRICISDGPVALNATPVGGTWSGIGVSGFNFIPSATAVGNFILTYTYTNQYGCTTTDTTTAKVSACDERNISLASGGAVLFPNPNGGQFNIRVNSTRFQYLQMRIYNQLGQLISTKQWSGLVYGQILPVNMNHLPAAVYTVRIIYDGGNLYEDRGYKMIIQH